MNNEIDKGVHEEWENDEIDEDYLKEDQIDSDLEGANSEEEEGEIVSTKSTQETKNKNKSRKRKRGGAFNGIVVLAHSPSCSVAPRIVDRIKTPEKDKDKKEEKDEITKLVEEWNCDTKLGFGIHAGKKLKEIPIHYLRWLAGYKWDQVSKTFVEMEPVTVSKYTELAANYLLNNKICLVCGKRLHGNCQLVHSDCRAKHYTDHASLRNQHKKMKKY